jgi:flagellin
MRINNNLMAMNTHRQLGINTNMGQKSIEKLSSGFRINRAGDDAAGLAISEKMRGQIRGLNMASRNAQDGISLVQTAEGALTETHAILQRMRELAVQSANDTNINVDRSEIQKEINELIDEIDRIATTTQFNQQDLLTGEFKGVFHIGANEKQNITLNISNMEAGKAATVEIDGDVTIAPEFDGASVSGVDGFTTSGSVAFEITHSAGSPATTLSSEGMTKAGTGTAAATIDGTYTGASDVAEIVLTNTNGVWDINGETVTADGNNFTWNGLTISLSDIGNAADGDTFTYSTEVKAAVPAGISATIDGEAVTQTIESGAGEKTYTTASGKSITADLGTFTFTDDTKNITFDVTVEQVAEADKGLQVGQLKVDDVTKDSVGGVMTQAGADKAITTIQSAIETVSAERSKLGAMQNRLEHTINNLDNTSENLQAAESRIRDVDMAKEMMEFTKQNILQQAATAMLAQANQAPQTVLQLLR